ncbi:DUF4238 domain-containing protein [Blastococcus sp. SYSU DS0669]
MPTSEPRKHHIIPAFYLAGFASPQSRTGRLRVFDYATGKTFVSTPKKVCRQTDYYRVEGVEPDPNATEKLLAWHEGVVAPHVQAVASGRITEKRQVGETLALAASLAVRNRQGRERLNTTMSMNIGMKIRQGHVSNEQWEMLRATAILNGGDPEDYPELDEATQKLLNVEWFPRAPDFLAIGTIAEAQEVAMNALTSRHWEAHVTDASTNGGFICSDNPLVWGDLDRMAAGHVASLDEADIEITFPVSKNVALVSYPGARDSTCATTDEGVARINARTLHLSSGLIFHSQQDFLLRKPSGELGRGSEFVRYVQVSRRRGILRP